MRGLTLRVTNATSPSRSLVLTDVPGLSPLVPGEVRDLLYTDEVQVSLEYGVLNAAIKAGNATVQFVSGTNLSQAPIGRVYTGATSKAPGLPGLVPTAPSAKRAGYLKADGTWVEVTPETVGAISEDVLTTQGDTLVRGRTRAERVPFGSLGQSYRAGLTAPYWQSVALNGTLAHRPLAGPTLAGVLYWSADQPSGSQLSICYYNGGGYAWATLGDGGGGGGNTNTVVVEFNHTTSSPLTVGSVSAGQYLDRALVVTGTAWDGTTPTVEFGTTSSHSLLLQTTDVDLKHPGQYESGELHKFVAGDDLILTITSSGSSTGTGTLLFTLVG